MLRPQAIAATGQRILFFECPLSLFITLVAGWTFPGNTGGRASVRRPDTPSGESVKNGWTKAAFGSEAGNL
ncbi:hypothetical protein NB647_04725 [Oxalobacter aliiformigenes]|uniref:hypothetical protein n=1 Tax=Oxalobacter aliiformigenes TaxID=2946593 RepID=UPI0022AFA2C6|nr:hypothetical protein [Oxalobacter aliiformigenes]WAV90102.1 hypothetical protein NB647_04725 [Oxalobacter aliiformigenes]